MVNNAVNHREIMVNPMLPTELQWYMRNFVLDLMKITEEFLFSIFALIYLFSSYRIFILLLFIYLLLFIINLL